MIAYKVLIRWNDHEWGPRIASFVSDWDIECFWGEEKWNRPKAPAKTVYCKKLKPIRVMDRHEWMHLCE